jgi:2-polyprenyl-3-methyl-5-hydroxy-6-metoxy-1,4-benzoquinol methylase
MQSCRICHSKNQLETINVREMMYGSRITYKYFQCGDCGTVQIAEPAAVPAKLYPDSYYSLHKDKPAAGLKQRLKKKLLQAAVRHEMGRGSALDSLFAELLPRPDARALRGLVKKETSILDVGCGSGALLKALAGLGFVDLTGCDPFISSEISANGFTVFKRHLQDFGASKRFDLVMMRHSFEHMEDPDQTLEHVKRLLAENGHCIIRIPMADSEAFDTYGENWGQLDAPRHCFLYTNKSIEILASRHGFVVQKLEDDSTAFQFVSSEQFLKDIPLNGFRSYYRPFYRKWLVPSAISAGEVRKYHERSKELNKLGRGDQRVFYLRRV